MNLEIDITCAADGSKIWIEDLSSWYDIDTLTGLNYDQYVKQQSITFIDYIDSEGNTTTIDETINIPTTTSSNQVYAKKRLILTTPGTDGDYITLYANGKFTQILFQDGVEKLDATDDGVAIIDSSIVGINTAETIGLQLTAISNIINTDYSFEYISASTVLVTANNYITGDIEISESIPSSGDQWIAGLTGLSTSSEGQVTGVNTLDSANSIVEIEPSDLTTVSWSVFPEGVYNIKFGVTVQENVPEPNNNTTYYYQQVLFWDIAAYLASLFVSISQAYNGYTDPDTEEVYGALKDDYLYRYTVLYSTKYEALKAAIAVSGNSSTVTATNVKEVLNNLLILQKLKAQYPQGQFTRRFKK